MPWRLTRLALMLGSFGLVCMELTFIIEDLALLCFDEPPGLANAKSTTYLIEHSSRVVKVCIDGPCEIFVVSLCPH